MTSRCATGLIAALALGLLAGCASDPTSEPSEPSEPSATAGTTATSARTPAATPEPTPSPEPTAAVDTLPTGFPDPESLVGQDAYDEQGPDGWHTVVGGQPVELALAFGACFDGGTGDVCGHSISGHVPAGPDGQPGASDAALLLLLRSTGTMADGTPTWVVLDAVVTRAPDGTPAYLEPCDGEQGVAYYPVRDAEPGPTVAVEAAWGPDDTVSTLVELEPADVTCMYVGE